MKNHPKNTDFIKDFAEAAESDESVEGSKPKSEDFAKMLGESFKKSSRKLSVGDKIRGEILVLGKEEVFVSTGTQHDAMMSRRELNDENGNCPFKTGDKIDVYVTQVRGSDIRVSRNPTDKNLAEDLEDAYDMMLPIQGRVVEVCKGGVRVNVKGKIAFCPISQLDVKHVETGEEYVGRSFDFQITQFSEGGRNIVVSRRKLLEEERELNLGGFLEEHPDGSVVTGKISRLEKFGAFVELAPSVDGLIHISELAWFRVNDPAEVVQVGQEVQVKILKREVLNNKAKISLSLRQTTPRELVAPSQAKEDPLAKFKPGEIVTGKVSRKEVYGLFIQLEGGATGLLHKSKAADHPEFPYEKLKVGDTATVQIDEIRADDRRISLTIPQDPNRDDWKQHAQQSSGSFGTLGDKLKAAMVKTKK